MFGRLTKIKAGALQYVLIISVIIAILLLAFVLLINVQKQLATKQLFYKETIFNVNNGLEYLCQQDIRYDEVISKQFSSNQKETTDLLKKKWGIFDVGIVKSNIGNEFFEKIALLGGQQKQRKALYLQDNNTPLVLVGHAKIVGDVQLPMQGVKTGNISGTSFYGDRLIEGAQHTSTNTLPIIEGFVGFKEVMNYFYAKETVQDLQLEEHTKVTQSFLKNTLIYETSESVFLRNISLKGNIVIQSARKIVVDSSANLTEVILIAPQIEIKENTIGSFQAFASQQILVGKNCQINYPSALILENEKFEKEKEHKIMLEKGVKFRGVLLFKQGEKQEETQRSYKPQMIIENEVIVKGEVYCEGNLELLGNVIGTVTTKDFLTNQFGSTYINYIYHGKINVEELPEAYVGVNVASNHQNIAKWLY